ncbi:MAG: DNA polymerase I [Campylobacter sp.]|uniref:DNA polymerase I n=1 Tax=Campylobacter sp. TaxID=205 RepID=UPI002AA6CBF1|nr:DNA polymerase I [Campylobacter sp.]MCI6579798.1 DNA polymerase I [Campylobacter sp.]
MKKINIIDSFGLFFRLYYAMMGLRSATGKPSGMVSGLATFIEKMNRDFPCDYAIFAFEGGGATFRHEIYPAYKATRKEAPAELKEQIPVCKEMIERMGFASFAKAGYEADDVIASLVKKYSGEYEIDILSGDKDLFALISDSVKIVDSKNKIWYDKEGCFQKYGVYPQQMRDYLAILGDTSDNVPGIKGLGERGARAILEQFGSLENAIANAEQIANTRAKNQLIAGAKDSELSKRLITLYADIQGLPEIEDCLLPKEPFIKVRDILKDYSLNRILTKLQKTEQKELFDEPDFLSSSDEKIVQKAKDKELFSKVALSFESVLILDENELDVLTQNLSKNCVVALDTETTGLDVKTAKIVGFSFCVLKSEQRAYYVPLAHNYLGAPAQISQKAAKRALERIYKTQVVGHNLKYDFEILRNNFGLELPKNYADTMILAWLENPEQKCAMDELASRLFAYETIKFESLVNVKKGQVFGDIEVELASKYASEDAFITLEFYKYFKQVLSQELWEVAKNLEFPFIATLISLEKSGIKADYNALNALNEKISARLKELEAQIYKIAGQSFNINSPKQLGAVLFEHLGLKAAKKTKSGYSTDESVLNSLEHPIAAPLLEFRELAKLKGTYTEPFMRLSSSGERVYTHFLHTGTATGRLSSHSPNLQNIPARGNLARDVRNCFVAQDENMLISLDYSQIELRLLAHFSADPALIAAFKADEDIHARTAISIFGDSEPSHRAVAKSINFGLIYGMGSSRLAKNLDISTKEAKEYIERYFASFSTIKAYLASIKTHAREQGRIFTLLGRQRVFDFSLAGPREQALYEREAVNSVFQGSAADIIKLAMNAIYSLLDENHKMILQIHDELIFEVDGGEAEIFAKKVANIMENVVSLNVPLKVNYAIAKSWGELK